MSPSQWIHTDLQWVLVFPISILGTMWILFCLKVLFSCVLYVGSMCLHVPREGHLREVELQGVVGHSTWVLRIKLKSMAKIVK